MNPKISSLNNFNYGSYTLKAYNSPQSHQTELNVEVHDKSNSSAVFTAKDVSINSPTNYLANSKQKSEPKEQITQESKSIRLKSNYNFTLNKLAEALLNEQEDIWETVRDSNLFSG